MGISVIFRRIDLRVSVLSKKTLRIDRGHAARAGCRHSLSVIRVVRIAARKNTRDLSLHRTHFRLEISDFICIENAVKKVGIRFVGDRYKGTLRRIFRRAGSLTIEENDGLDPGFLRALDLLDL